MTSTAQAIVCPVNCVGVMGKGLAKQIKDKYPNINKAYVDLCKKSSIRLRDHLIAYTDHPNNVTVIFFPTKFHWLDDSELDDLILTLEQFVSDIDSFSFFKSIAVPMLGCGNGGLDEKVVLPLLRNFFAPVSSVIEIWRLKQVE